MSRLHHEQIYRGKELIEKLSAARIVICGAGALGSNLARLLARSGCNALTIIDRDRVEERNIGTQVYALSDVGARKAEIMRNLLYREVGVECKAVTHELTQSNCAKLLRDSEIVVDTFDNSASRRFVFEHCGERKLPCLHAGVNNEYGEVVWNERYRVPSDVGEDVCDYPLALNMITIVATLASETLVRFIGRGKKDSYSFTLQDLSINLDDLPAAPSTVERS